MILQQVCAQGRQLFVRKPPLIATSGFELKAIMHEREQALIFDEWLNSHKALLFKVVHAYAFTPADRDDLFQEIVTQIWRSIPAFRRESAVTTWIYRVALYSAIAWSRNERKHQTCRQPNDGIEHALVVTPRAPNPRLDWLYEQIARLDEIDRSLMLMMLDGFSYREMAATLGISESNVGVKINRIKADLIRKTKKEHHGL
jgi:RNA polymerase sigma-70 factor (ECF subfamily)